MARGTSSGVKGGTTLEDVATRLDVTNATRVAEAVLDIDGGAVRRQFNGETAAVAALRIASRRTEGRELDLERACERLALESGRVAHAEDLLRRELSPPADDDEIEALRRAINAYREVLVAAENDRAHAPRLPGYVIDEAGPTAGIGVRANANVGHLDDEQLRTHIERLEADLQMARLGVELYGKLHAGR